MERKFLFLLGIGINTRRISLCGFGADCVATNPHPGASQGHILPSWAMPRLCTVFIRHPESWAAPVTATEGRVPVQSCPWKPFGNALSRLSLPRPITAPWVITAAVSQRAPLTGHQRLWNFQAWSNCLPAPNSPRNI